MNGLSVSQMALIDLLLNVMQRIEQECLQDPKFDEWLGEQNIFTRSIGDLLPTISY